MKKINKEELISILKNNNNLTYDELSVMTGYHPKSLIRINKLIKDNRYKVINRVYKSYNKLSEELINDIISLYASSNYKTLKMFYNFELKNKYKISYSKVCEILRVNIIKDTREILFIVKKDNYLLAIDNIKGSIIYKKECLKFSKNTVEEFIKDIFFSFGVPKSLCFHGLLTTPIYIKDLSNKYNFDIVTYSSKYKNIIQSSTYDKIISYNKISKELIYNFVIRKLIADNIIQFKNKRYKILSNYDIKHLQKVTLYYNKDYTDLFIKHLGNIFYLELLSSHKSFTGNSKY